MDRDFSRSVGVDAPSESSGVPGWVFLTFPPLAAPLLAAAWLRAHWSEIPERFPVHFGLHGPDRWATRTAFHVYGPLFFAEGLVLLMLGIAAVVHHGSRGPASRQRTPRAIFLAVMYLMSLIFTSVGLLPLAHFPPWIIALVSVLGAITLIVWLARKNAEPDDTPDDTPPECWTSFGTSELYSNPQDPALFVPDRKGTGYALNFGNPWAKPFLAATIAAVGGLTAFLFYALQ